MSPLTGLLPALVVSASQQAPDDNDVVAGWTAFAVFVLLILAVVVLGFSLTKRLKNVARADADGRYAPSTPRAPTKPLRGLAAARAMREQAAAEGSAGRPDDAAPQTTEAPPTEPSPTEPAPGSDQDPRA